MAKSFELDHLLENDEYSKEMDVNPNLRSKNGQLYQRNCIRGLSILLLLSVVINLLQATIRTSAVSIPSLSADIRSNYSNLRSNEIQLEWLQESGYTSSNTTLRDHLWDAINHDSGIVAVPEAWAAEKGLPMGSTFPWDSTKKIYFVNAFHGLHCVKNIYRSFMEYRKGINQSLSPHHIIHCLDQIRADILCTADDTLRVTTPDMRPVTGEGQVRQCRSWDALKAWTMDNPGCYRYGDPNVEDVQESQIPRMRYCEEGNPNLGLIRAYFDKGADWRPADDRVWSWFDNMDG